MRNDSNIVSFEDAKRSVRGRFVSNQGRSRTAPVDNGRAPKHAREDEEQEPEPQLSLKEAKKRARSKAKAESAFNKMYGDGDASGKGILGKLSRKSDSAASNDSAGPRAAVYKGEMGSKHRKAAAMQSGKSGGGLALRLPFSFSFGKPKAKDDRGDSYDPGRSHSVRGVGRTGRMVLRVGIGALCAIIFCVSIYAPAQQCYVQIRERDRLAAEYDAVLQRNEILTSNVENLQSNAGVEDLAHSSFGLVKDGENAASVTGVDLKDKSTFTAKIIPGSVPAPDTWYSDMLDWLFGYSS